MTEPRFTDRDKADCAKRELTQRRRVYERMVEAGRMTRQKADREIALMEEIAADYGRWADKGDASGRLL